MIYENIGQIPFISGTPSWKLYSKDNALELLKLLNTMNAEIYGVSASKLVDGKWHFIRGNSLVFSMQDSEKIDYDSHEIYDSVKEVLHNAEKDTYFHIVYSTTTDERGIPFLLSGFTKMYSKKAALKMLDVISSRGSKLWGIDSFNIIGEGIQPSMEHSIDFTADPFTVNDYTSKEVYRMAEELLERVPDDMYFEFVYESND